MNNNSKTRAVLASALLAAALWGGINNPAFADETHSPDNSALQSRIETLQKQVDDLSALLQQLNKQQVDLEEKQKATDDAAQKAVDASKKGVKSKLDVTASGLLQVHALAPISGDGSRGNSTFRLRRGEVKLTAKVDDRISGWITFDVAKAKNSGTTKDSDSVLQEIAISYLLNRGKNKNYIEVGQFKPPLGYESLVSSSALPFLERSLIYAQGKYGDTRDGGAQLRGNAGKVEYRLGVFNGLGEYQNTTSNRDGKAVAGRVLLNAADGLQVGASAARGVGGGRITNLFFDYKKKSLWLGGEYGKGSNGSGSSGIVNGDGFNLSAGYRLAPKWELVGRYDSFNDKAKGKAMEGILGLNYYLKSNSAKIQLNLVHHDGPLGSGSGYQYDWTEFRSGFQLAF